MWVLLDNGAAVNVAKLDVISVGFAKGLYFLEFAHNAQTYRIKGTFASQALATAALVAITGAVDAAA